MSSIIRLNEKIAHHRIPPSSLFFLIATSLLSLNFIRPFGLAISDWLYFLSLFCAILETFFDKPSNYKQWFGNRFLGFTVLFLIGAGISLFRSKFPSVAIYEIIQQLYIMTLFVSLCYLMVRRGQMGLVINAFIFSGVLTASVALWDYGTGARLGPLLSGTLNSQLYYRFAGTLGHPNKFGYFLVLTSLLTLGKWATGRFNLSQHIGLGLILLVQGFGIYLSGSVTAYLGFLLGSAALVLFSHTKRILLMGLALMITLPLILTLISSNVATPVSSNAATPVSNNTATPVSNDSVIGKSVDRVQTITAGLRWNIYLQAINDIIHSPFIGVGSDQVSTSGISGSERQLDDTVHNVLLQIWYTAGLFGFLGWAGIYIYLGWNSVYVLWHGYKENLLPIIAALVSAVLAILLMDQFQDAIYQREKWLVFGLFAGWIWMKKEKRI